MIRKNWITTFDRGICMEIDDFIKFALAEDVGRGDLFASVVPPTPTKGKIIAKSGGVLAGKIYVDRFAKLENFTVEWNFNDGDSFKKGDVILHISGDSHTVLRVERTTLNIVLHASSIATLTREYLNKISKHGTKLLDTRKTKPLLRNFEKYATRVGGAINHRMGLDDALMLKDTHLKTIKDLDCFLEEARKSIPFTTTIEVEVETVAFAKEVLSKDVNLVMCDNMSPDEVKEVVLFRDENYPKVLLEASGNMSLSTIESYAETGVDAISVGGIIHQAKWIDLSMKID
jgi:nicotinate-nucleotide pyrophosphorylase (carboxylating)